MNSNVLDEAALNVRVPGTTHPTAYQRQHSGSLTMTPAHFNTLTVYRRRLGLVCLHCSQAYLLVFLAAVLVLLRNLKTDPMLQAAFVFVPYISSVFFFPLCFEPAHICMIIISEARAD